MNIKEARVILSVYDIHISKQELKKRFKKEMLQWHPDISVNRGVSQQEATSRSQKIILAYEILSENIESLEHSSYQYNYKSYHSYKTRASKNYKQYFDYSIDTIDASFLNRITLKSSNVKWIDYIKELEILVVRFKKQSDYYLYYDVPELVFRNFMRTDSPGRFVNMFLYAYKYDRLSTYAEWLNVYKSLDDITDDAKN